MASPAFLARISLTRLLSSSAALLLLLSILRERGRVRACATFLHLFFWELDRDGDWVCSWDDVMLYVFSFL